MTEPARARPAMSPSGAECHGQRLWRRVSGRHSCGQLHGRPHRGQTDAWGAGVCGGEGALSMKTWYEFLPESPYMYLKSSIHTESNTGSEALCTVLTNDAKSGVMELGSPVCSPRERRTSRVSCNLALFWKR